MLLLSLEKVIWSKTCQKTYIRFHTEVQVQPSYLLEKGTSEVTVILLLLLSMVTTPPPRFPALPFTLILSCRNCSCDRGAHPHCHNTTPSWLHHTTAVAEFTNSISNEHTNGTVKYIHSSRKTNRVDTYKVCSIHDAILHRMRTVQSEL